MPLVSRRVSELKDIEHYTSESNSYLIIPKDGIQGAVNVKALNQTTVVLASPDSPREIFEFDHLVHAESTSQASLFNLTSKALCEKVIEGHSGFILLTGTDDLAERDFYFNGNSQNPGLICRVLKKLLKGCSSQIDLVEYDDDSCQYLINMSSIRSTFSRYANRSYYKADPEPHSFVFLSIFTYDQNANSFSDLFDPSNSFKKVNFQQIKSYPISSFQSAIRDVKSALKTTNAELPLFIAFNRVELTSTQLSKILDSTFYNDNHNIEKLMKIPKDCISTLLLSNSPIEICDLIQSLHYKTRRQSFTKQSIANSKFANFFSPFDIFSNLTIIGILPQPNCSFESSNMIVRTLEAISGKKIHQIPPKPTRNSNSTPFSPVHTRKDSKPILESEFPAVKPAVKPKLLSNDKIHFCINDYNFQLPHEAEMLQWQAFDENALNHLHEAINKKLECSVKLEGHLMHNRNELINALGKNEQYIFELEKENKSLAYNLEHTQNSRQNLEQKLAHVQGKSLELKNEFNRLSSIYERRASEQVEEACSTLTYDFKTRSSKFRALLSQQNQRLALLRELAETNSMKEIQQKMNSAENQFQSPKQSKKF